MLVQLTGMTFAKTAIFQCCNTRDAMSLCEEEVEGHLFRARVRRVEKPLHLNDEFKRQRKNKSEKEKREPSSCVRTCQT